MTQSVKTILTTAGIEAALAGAGMYLITPTIVGIPAEAVLSTPLGSMSVGMASGLIVGASVFGVGALGLVSPDIDKKLKEGLSGFGKPLAAAGLSVLLSSLVLGSSLDGIIIYAKLAGGALAATFISDKLEDMIKDTNVLGY
jgi:hypothetical protein